MAEFTMVSHDLIPVLGGTDEAFLYGYIDFRCKLAHGCCDASLQTMANVTTWSVRKVQRVLDKLVANGHVTKKNRGNMPSCLTTNLPSQNDHLGRQNDRLASQDDQLPSQNDMPQVVRMTNNKKRTKEEVEEGIRSKNIYVGESPKEEITKEEKGNTNLPPGVEDWLLDSSGNPQFDRYGKPIKKKAPRKMGKVYGMEPYITVSSGGARS